MQSVGKRASPRAAQRAQRGCPLIDPSSEAHCIIMAELAGHWAAGTPMAETPWLDDAAQAAQRYEEAAAVAVEACADDTRGQTCYICHGEGDEDEGLPWMRVPRG